MMTKNIIVNLLVLVVLFQNCKKEEVEKKPDNTEIILSSDTIPPVCKIIFQDSSNYLFAGDTILINVETHDVSGISEVSVYLNNMIVETKRDPEDANIQFYVPLKRIQQAGNFLKVVAFDKFFNGSECKLNILVKNLYIKIDTVKFQNDIVAFIRGKIGNVNTGKSIIRSGLLYSNSNKVPTKADEILSFYLQENGVYYTSLCGLTPNVTYYFRTFFELADTIIYSNVSSFKTAPLDSGIYTDSRDGKSYRWVKIANQIWMAENLRYNSNAAIDLGDVYGCLYKYDEIENACPAGWHIPSYKEWNDLFNNVGRNNEATMLKESGDAHWGEYNNAVDKYGFRALPAGFMEDGHNIEYTGEQAVFWISGEPCSAYGFQEYEGVFAYTFNMDCTKLMFCLRCIKNN